MPVHTYAQSTTSLISVLCCPLCALDNWQLCSATVSLFIDTFSYKSMTPVTDIKCHCQTLFDKGRLEQWKLTVWFSKKKLKHGEKKCHLKVVSVSLPLVIAAQNTRCNVDVLTIRRIFTSLAVIFPFPHSCINETPIQSTSKFQNIISFQSINVVAREKYLLSEWFQFYWQKAYTIQCSHSVITPRSKEVQFDEANAV